MMKNVVNDQIFLCHGVDVLPEGPAFRHLQLDERICYHPICDDFGPMNMASVLRFVDQLDKELQSYPDLTLIYAVDGDSRDLTNAVFLLGCYMLLKLGMTERQVSTHFEWVDSKIEHYRDATFRPSSFDLTLQDCWRGLAKGVEQGWVAMPAPDASYLWGEIDLDEYEHYDSTVNGDLHEVVPGMLVALRGPKDLDGALFRDDPRGFRDFSPAFYIDVLAGMGVTDVVRLNEPHYPADSFERHGLRVHELEFEDCTPPPPQVMQAFLRVCDEAAGAVAVHCKAGLGRTGTLIALYLMARMGWCAREAMGWLRIMRPGSVIGRQQHFLRAVEDAGFPRGLDLVLVEGSGGWAQAAATAQEVGLGVVLRAQLKARSSSL